MWYLLQVVVFAALAHVYAFSGGDWERVHRRVGVGPRGVDPLPGVKNAPLLRPVAVCAPVGLMAELCCRLRRGAAGGAGGC